METKESKLFQLRMQVSYILISKPLNICITQWFIHSNLPIFPQLDNPMKHFSFLACGGRISQVLGVSENLLLVKPSHNHHILVCGCWVAKMICTIIPVHKSQLFSFFNFSVEINKLLKWINSIVYLAGRKWAFSDTQKKNLTVSSFGIFSIPALVIAKPCGPLTITWLRNVKEHSCLFLETLIC